MLRVSVASGTNPIDETTATHGLFRRVLDEPSDDGPRLVLADWLDDQGDPRGEFIRVQLALARLADDDDRRPDLARREELLANRHRRFWDQPLRGLADGWDYRRGFAEVARGGADRWLSRADQLFGQAPIRSAEIYDVGGHLTSIAQAPWLIRLESLTVFASRQPAVAGALASAKLDHLSELFLGRNDIDDDGVSALACSDRLTRLATLDLADNRISAVGARGLAGSATWGRLERLDLSGNPLGPDGVAALVETHSLRRLHVLRLARTNLGPIGATQLSTLAGLKKFSEINLAANALGNTGARALASSCYTPAMECLGLARNEIGRPGLDHLRSSDRFPNLRQLDLSGNELDDDAIIGLTSQNHWPQLTGLDLRDNPFRGRAVRALIDAPLQWPLTRLWLDRRQVDPWLLPPLQKRYGSALRLDSLVP